MKNKDKLVVLVVEDEPAQLELLTYNLEAAGFLVDTASDGEDALIKVAETPPDLILLDWMLPLVSGIEICRRLKSKSKTRAIPIIMLSARNDEVDLVRGLNTGADDYVGKPYSVVELIARVRSHLRRVRAEAIGGIMAYEDIELNGETHEVSRAGVRIKLGPTEYRLLATLLEKPGRVWSRQRLLDRVWGLDIYVETRTVDVHVGRLRKALCAHGGDDLVRTIRGSGYALGG